MIATNVQKRAERMFKGEPNLPIAIRNASAESDSERIAKSTVQRILDRRTSCTLEQLEGLARALDLSPYQLLIQDLDPKSPQVAKGATLDEQQLYNSIGRLVDAKVEEKLASTDPGTYRIKRKPRGK